MNNQIVWLLLIIWVGCNGQLYSQNSNSSEKEVQSVIKDEVRKQLGKSDKLLTKIEVFDQQIEGLEKQIESLRNADGHIKTGKIVRLERKKSDVILKSRTYVSDAYKLRFKAYQKQIGLMVAEDSLLQGQQDGVLKKSEDKYNEGRKMLSKAANVGKAARQVELIVQGRQKLDESIELQIAAISSFMKKAELPVTAELVSPEPMANVKTTVADVKPVSIPVTPPSAPVPAAAVSVPVVAPVIVPPVTEAKPTAARVTTQNDLKDLFITVQIMASKVPATKAQIAQVYKGSYEVMEFKSADYIRYAVGKFRTAEEAKAFMLKENFKGIVVAYKNNERITVAEATTLLKP